MGNVSTWFNTAAANDTGSPPDRWPEGQAPSTVNDCAREMQAALKRWYDEVKGYGLTTAGTGDAYTLTTASTHAALTDQPLLVFEADRANTGSATLNVDGLGAKTIKKNATENLAADDIKANQVIIVAYENTADVYHLLSYPDPVNSVTAGGTFPNVNADVTATDEQLNDVANKAKIATGTYTGDGTQSNSITGLGFQPKHVKIITTADSIYETWSSLITEHVNGMCVVHQTAGGHTRLDNRIKSFDSDGFTVSDDGVDAPPNANGDSYDWVAMG